MSTLGKVMAVVDMERRKANINSIVVCPFCGHDMKYNGAAWFCEGGEMNDRQQRSSCVPDSGMLSRFCDAPAGEGGWKDGFTLTMEPGVPVAMAGAVIVNGHPVAEIRRVRPGGWSVVGVDVPDKEVPELINQYGWTWYAWVWPPEN